ncbi:hypothetical protein Athai_39110 [Actinocatenispora thailandica]|uniref:JmjC domain-containing protein n=1 Tax=Actinocatenispora thailandica TaxID=227318 RepID=A0A7R7HXW3_9ACTN|nr:hypothetical protein Athai_39110 [Actinocatenispora thailandica]
MGPTPVPADPAASIGSVGRPTVDRPTGPAGPTDPASPTGPPGPTRPAGPLARLVGADVDGFARSYWSRRPLLVRGADPDAFRDLLDLDGVDELLSYRGLRTPFLRLARDGAVLDSASFTGPGGVGAEIADQVRDDRVAALFADGCTVVLQALHRNWPPIVEFGTALAAELGHPVQVNAYVTPPSAQGFAAHYDVHDVFVLQLAGGKHWRVHPPVHPDPLRDQPWTDHAAAVADRAEREPPELDTVLGPGDAMYLPRGWLHAATALGDVSAHLTVGVPVLTRFAVLEALVASLAAEPELRRSLPLGIDPTDPAQLAPQLAAVRAALARAVPQAADETVARRLRSRVWSGGRPEPVRPVAAARFAANLSPGDTVRRRAGLPHRLVERDDHVVLELADRRIRLPATTTAALRCLLAGGTAQVGELPELPVADQLVLVRRLLREGVLVPSTGP